MAEDERSGPYLVSDGITMTLYITPQAAGGSVQKRSAARFASRLVKRFKESTIQVFMARVCEVFEECGENVPDTNVQLTFVESRSKMNNMSGRLRMSI